MPERPTDLDGRVRLVWTAVTWLQRGKTDPALGLLQTLAAPSLDAWSAAVLRGASLLREADAHASGADWARADRALREAAGASVRLELVEESGGIVLARPDPWLHFLDAFAEHLDRARRAREAAAGLRHPAVLQ